MKFPSIPQSKRVICLTSLFLCGTLTLHAQAKKAVPSAPAAKPSAPAKAPSAPAASHPGGASTAGHTGATTAGHTGPTTAGHTGPTTAGHTGATTSNPRTTTGGFGGGGAHTAGGGTGNRAGGGPGAGRGGSAIGHPMPAGGHEMRTANGATVRTRANGSRSDIHDERRGMDVHRGLNGERHVSMERADHSRVFAERGGRGYVQHPYMYRGHEFGHRTYYRDGRAYDRYYGRSYYRGAYLDVYAPGYYYNPGFYGWAYNPWSTPISYSWGFAGNPWYGYYGAAYFTPYSSYPSASYWLTDYLISQSLSAAYAAQVEAQQAQAPLVGAAPLTPDIKRMVADEVQRQVALENQEAAQNAQKQDVDTAGSSIARMLGDNQPHVFIAGSGLDLVDANGAECAVSQGDVLEVASAPPPDASAATALVLTTKGGKECMKSANVQIAFTDLQDMQNHMRETVDAGLSDLQKKQGSGGLPPAPPSAKAPPVQSAFAAVAPPPDPNAATEIKQETQDADKAEQEAGSTASGPADTGYAPVISPPAAVPATTTTLSLGQTMEQVTASMGAPKTVIDKGATKIYVYADVKVTFKGNKVTDIQ